MATFLVFSPDVEHDSVRSANEECPHFLAHGVMFAGVDCAEK
jgi:hypothetical protein